MVAERLKALRAEKQITQVQLAEMLGVSKGTVAMWETGKSVPTMKNMIALSEILNTDVEILVKSFPKLNNIVWKNNKVI